MTGKDIQELFQKELGLYEFIDDVEYDEKTKELYFQIVMNFDEEYNFNQLFAKEIIKRTYPMYDIEFTRVEGVPTLIFTVKNKTITAEINTPFELELFDLTKSIFEDYLHKWGIY